MLRSIKSGAERHPRVFAESPTSSIVILPQALRVSRRQRNPTHCSTIKLRAVRCLQDEAQLTSSPLRFFVRFSATMTRSLNIDRKYRGGNMRRRRNLVTSCFRPGARRRTPTGIRRSPGYRESINICEALGPAGGLIFLSAPRTSRAIAKNCATGGDFFEGTGGSFSSCCFWRLCLAEHSARISISV